MSTAGTQRIAAARIPELDGVRGLAVVMVVVFHYSMPSLRIPLGWSGVDLFFVLSGFLISGILLDTRFSPDYYRTFYLRRAARIVPAYALLLLARAVVPASSATVETIPTWSYLLFLQNWMIAIWTGSWVWNVTWSLAIEEQFYATLAPVVRRFGQYLREIAIGMVVLSVAARILLSIAVKSIGQYHWTVCRLDGLGLGILCMLAMRGTPPRWVPRATIILALGMLGFGYLDYAGKMQGLNMAIGLLWIDAFYAAAMLTILTHTGKAAFFRARPMRIAGKYSYFIYLFHQLIGYACQSVGAPKLLAAVVTLASAAASWALLESPLLRAAHRATARV